MAAWLNKWLVISTVPFLFYTGFLLSPTGMVAPVTARHGHHPFHVSVVEVNHNAADKTLEISCKLFTDDFEKILTRNYSTRVDLINAAGAERKKVDTLIKKYIAAHLSLSADGKPVRYAYLGFEHETDALYTYLQVDGIASVKKIGITNKLMHDLFDDQINLMHVTVGGIRKSTKLDYPASTAEFSF